MNKLIMAGLIGLSFMLAGCQTREDRYWQQATPVIGQIINGR